MIDAARSLARGLILHYLRWKDIQTRRRLGMMERDLSPGLWDMQISAAGHLLIGACDVTDLGERFGTPLQVVDAARMRKNFVQFATSFRRHYPRVEVGYSYKTNPLPGVLSELHRAGAWAEVISHFELWLAFKLGVAPERTVFNGPGKTPEGLNLAVARGVHMINVDNVSEADYMQDCAARIGRKQRVGVRVITSVGWSSQFGLSIASGAAWEAFERIRGHPNLVPCGLHLHLGTGIHDVAVYLQAVEEVLQFAQRLRRDLDIHISFFDFGGGFGVPTVRPFSGWDERLMASNYPPLCIDVGAASTLDDYGRGISGIMRGHYPDMGAHDLPTMFFEPGRALTSSAQTLLLEVLAVKPGGPRDSLNVILNGGKNIAMPPGYEYHEVFAATRMTQPASRFLNLFGPLCHPADVISRMKRLPGVLPGDLIAIMDAGAYFVPNQMNFSNPRPAAVMVDAGRARLIRDRERFEDIILHDLMEDAGAVNAAAPALSGLR